MKSKLHLHNCIDIDFFHFLDSHKDRDQTELHARDRAIYLQYKSEHPTQDDEPHNLLQYWLTARKKECIAPPGQKIAEAQRLLHYLMLFLGLFAGGSLAGSYFVYTGSTPLNVFIYFFLFILPQLFFLILFFLGGAFSRAHIRQGPFLSCIKMVFLRLHSGLSHLSKTKTQQAGLSEYVFRLEKTKLLSWSLLCSSQLFGVGFSIAVVLVTLVKIATSDLAFGWQTTLDIGPEALHKVTLFLSMPWSWFLPEEYAFPSLAQIEGTRIILKESIANLSSVNLRAWWPFMLMSLLIYGLLPRLILLVFTLWKEMRWRASFTHNEEYSPIIRRMKLPTVTTQAAPIQKQPVYQPQTPRVERPPESQNDKTAVTLLIPVDISSEYTTADLSSMLSEDTISNTQVNTVTIFDDYADDMQLLQDLEASTSAVPTRYIVLLEGWMVPIGEQLNFIKKMVELIVPQNLNIILLGRSHNGTISKPTEMESAIWHDKLSPLEESLTYLIPAMQKVGE